MPSIARTSLLAGLVLLIAAQLPAAASAQQTLATFEPQVATTFDFGLTIKNIMRGTEIVGALLLRASRRERLARLPEALPRRCGRR